MKSNEDTKLILYKYFECEHWNIFANVWLTLFKIFLFIQTLYASPNKGGNPMTRSASNDWSSQKLTLLFLHQGTKVW